MGNHSLCYNVYEEEDIFMYTFSSKVKCGLCGSTMKIKKEKNRINLICSNYSKDSSSCKRIPVDQYYLIFLVRNRYGDISEEEIRSRVDYVEVFGKEKTKQGDVYKLTIHFHDDEPIILSGKNDTLWVF